jgi:Domain of unknown function (DUF4078)
LYIEIAVPETRENSLVFGKRFLKHFLSLLMRLWWKNLWRVCLKGGTIKYLFASINHSLISFAEAREHGVGFYEFSTDHEEREKQQEALNKIRDATLDAQKQRSDLKQSRDNIIANRVKLARARVRARLGLPPEEEKPEETDENLYDVTDKKMEKEEEAARKRAAVEKRKELERQKHIRPWDKNKLSSKKRDSSSESEDETDWKPRREYQPMSQGKLNIIYDLFMQITDLWCFRGVEREAEAGEKARICTSWTTFRQSSGNIQSQQCRRWRWTRKLAFFQHYQKDETTQRSSWDWSWAARCSYPSSCHIWILWTDVFETSSFAAAAFQRPWSLNLCWIKILARASRQRKQTQMVISKWLHTQQLITVHQSSLYFHLNQNFLKFQKKT